MNLLYPYTVLADEDGRYVVQFVDLEEAFTEGGTPHEAAFHAAQVLSLVLQQRLEDDVPIPQPSASADLPTAAPEASVQAALLMRWARELDGRTISGLARAMHTSWPAAQRLEQPNSNPTLKQLERAAAALGRRLVLSMV
jgi:antitoxin HicB